MNLVLRHVPHVLQHVSPPSVDGLSTPSINTDQLLWFQVGLHAKLVAAVHAIDVIININSAAWCLCN